MYFSEQGNVDDDVTLTTIFLVSFNLQSYCLMQSAVCSLQMSYTTSAKTSANFIEFLFSASFFGLFKQFGFKLSCQ